VDKQLPFVIDGRRRLAPRDEARSLRFDGEGSASLPRLTEACVDEILALDRFILRDVPLYEIIAFIKNVGQNWKSTEYARRRLYTSTVVELLGYSPAMAENEANWIALILSSHSYLYDQVAAELGDRHVLDRWVPRDEVELRALPRGRSLHILPGNVPLSCVASLVRGLLTKNSCVLKASSSDPVTPIFLALSFLDVDAKHPVARAVQAVHWPSDEDGSPQRRLLQGCDAVVAWGDRPAMEWATRHASSEAELVRFGPRRSLALIGRAADPVKAAECLAHDVAVYDQRACFSVRQVFVEGDPSALCSALREKLADYARLLPARRPDFDQQACAALAAHEEAFLGSQVWESSDASFRVIVCAARDVEPHPLGRTLYVHPVERLEQAAEFVTPDVQTIAAFPWQVMRELREEFARRGACRIVELGMNNLFRAGGSHDGILPMQRLVRFVSMEAPARVHTKGVTIAIDQTALLRHNHVLDFVP
jgi:long-chain-fatty-acyl-CoA reductase